MTQRPKITNTREFVDVLRCEDELLEIHDEIDPELELAEIQRRVVKKRGKALLFHNVKGCEFKVATNLFGSEKRIDLAFSRRPQDLIKQAVESLESFFPPSLDKVWGMRGLARDLLKVGCKKVSHGPVLEREIPEADLTKLPQIKSWPLDGGAFVTLPLVYTESPETGKPNLGMYRVQLFDKNECGMHIQIHRGGGFHYHEAQNLNQALPVHIYIGGPPALIISAIAPLPEDCSELLLASLLMGRRIKQIHGVNGCALPVLAEADFCIAGEILSFERRPEGPFGDHYGYYSLKHDYPCVKVDKIYHRKDAIYPATVVGRPPQEDHYITCYLQDLLEPLIRMVMPQVKQVWAYEESGVHSLAGAVVRDRYPREALVTAHRILGEGQLSLTKMLLVTDQDCDVKDFRKLLQIVLERACFETDLFVLSHSSQDTLDYTGPRINEGSKAILLGLGEPVRSLPCDFKAGFSKNVFLKARVFCPGVLVVEGPAWKENDGILELLAGEEGLKPWPFVLLVDDANETVKTPEDFLWHVFTRFEPAADIMAKAINIKRMHIGFEPPVCIDCRIKPWYPDILTPDPDVVKRLGPVLEKIGL